MNKGFDILMKGLKEMKQHIDDSVMEVADKHMSTLMSKNLDTIQNLEKELKRIKATTKYWKRMSFISSVRLGRLYSQGRRHEAYSNFYASGEN